jgi:hypothetical protein
MRPHRSPFARAPRAAALAIVSLGLWGTILLTVGPVGAADLMRTSGRLQSLDPANGTMSLQEIGVNGTVAIHSVRFREAIVVIASRSHARPGEWHEAPTHVLRWPAGTFMTAVGVRRARTFDAYRIEIPIIE